MRNRAAVGPLILVGGLFIIAGAVLLDTAATRWLIVVGIVAAVIGFVLWVRLMLRQ